ncbi:hypothetical protein HLB23_37555 [Nocardia uniformis]|uniref:Uncharacterized protein n=1 Tax=Nocardia uniformis TaxID=53432 RepID=A0A849CAD3_9NOCA|nr:hypothetical protein [Nocardia uniformis]
MITNVSDTARWVAAYRAAESERPDALFHDRLAARVAGDRGRAIAAAAPRFMRSGWSLVVRTKLIDDLIATSLAEGCDRVLKPNSAGRRSISSRSSRRRTASIDCRGS